MPQYNSRKKQFDPNELDPCIAAEVRFKKQYFTMNEAKCVLCFVVFLLSVLLLAAGIMMIFQGSESSSDFDAQQNIDIDPSSQLVDLPTDYNEKEEYETEENIIEQNPVSNRRETKGPPLLLGGRIHTSPIKQSDIKITPNKLQESSEFDSYLKFTTSSPLLSNELKEDHPWKESIKKITTTSKTSATYSISGDKMPDLVPVFKSNEISAHQQSFDHINTSKIVQTCEQYQLQGYSTSDYAWTVLQRRIGNSPPSGMPLSKNMHTGSEVHLSATGLALKHFTPIGEGEHGFWWVTGTLPSLANKPSADIFTQMSNNQPFTTVDKDNDSHLQRNGASFRHKGAWWHKDSTLVSLNGNYGSSSNVAEGQSFFWANSKGSAYNIKPIVSMIMFRIKS
uniref:Fibrinogen C-terminal domain-containing protein n=1 Tax=Ditylenchus dipsaci TaxID=166011 RepID=A0A915CQT9_9BILA